MSAWQFKRDTRDPAVIYQEREERTCAGCQYKSRLWAMPICLKHDKAATVKCSKYKENS